MRQNHSWPRFLQLDFQLAWRSKLLSSTHNHGTLVAWPRHELVQVCQPVSCKQVLAWVLAQPVRNNSHLFMNDWLHCNTRASPVLPQTSHQSSLKTNITDAHCNSVACEPILGVHRFSDPHQHPSLHRTSCTHERQCGHCDTRCMHRQHVPLSHLAAACPQVMIEPPTRHTGKQGQEQHSS